MLQNQLFTPDTSKTVSSKQAILQVGFVGSLGAGKKTVGVTEVGIETIRFRKASPTGK